MDMRNCIHSILRGRYGQAADVIIEMLREKRPEQRRKKEQIAKILESKYLKIRDINDGYTLQEKAERVCTETYAELMFPESSQDNLSGL